MVPADHLHGAEKLAMVASILSPTASVARAQDSVMSGRGATRAAKIHSAGVRSSRWFVRDAPGADSRR